MSATNLQESRVKLAPGAIVMGCIGVLLTPILCIAITSEFQVHGLNWPMNDVISPLIFILVVVLIDVYAFQQCHAFFNPTRIDISTSDLSITSPRRRATYRWADLGMPTRKGGRSGRSSVLWIEIPRLDDERAKPIKIDGQKYRQPFNDVLDSLVRAKSGSGGPQSVVEAVRPTIASPTANEPVLGQESTARRRGALATSIMPVIFALKVFKLGKIGGTAITMVLSLAFYTLTFGWRYAAGFISLLFLHEMGHYLAAQRRGLKVGAPTFIPFVGAWINLKEQPLDAETEAYVALAGPFVGTLGATVCYLLARDLGSQMLLAIAYAGFFLNFFNLIPISPLDGGRITGVLSPRIWVLGVPVMLAMVFYRPSPLLVLIAIMAIPSLKKAWRYDRNAPENRAYYGIATAKRVKYAVLYLALTAYLALMTSAAHNAIGSLHSAASPLH